MLLLRIQKHCLTNVQGIVQRVITTAANRSDTKELIPLLESINIPQGTAILADKEYTSRENRSYLETHHLQDGIMHKAQRNRALTEQEKQRNKAISPIRTTIERTFGSIRRWFHGGRCRYRGLAKTHTQNILESIAFNLYRTPGIIMSSCVGRHNYPCGDRSCSSERVIYKPFYPLLPPKFFTPFIRRMPLSYISLFFKGLLGSLINLLHAITVS